VTFFKNRLSKILAGALAATIRGREHG
jgi:hypothetical protein